MPRGRGTGILPVVLHGRGAHVTGRGTGILPVVLHGRDAHATGAWHGHLARGVSWAGTPMKRMNCKRLLRA